MDKLERVAQIVQAEIFAFNDGGWGVDDDAAKVIAARILALLEPPWVTEIPLFELAEAMQELLDRPIGVVPASAEKYYDGRTGVFTAELIARALAERGE